MVINDINCHTNVLPIKWINKHPLLAFFPSQVPRNKVESSATMSLLVYIWWPLTQLANSKHSIVLDLAMSRYGHTHSTVKPQPCFKMSRSPKKNYQLFQLIQDLTILEGKVGWNWKP